MITPFWKSSHYSRLKKELSSNTLRQNETDTLTDWTQQRPHNSVYFDGQSFDTLITKEGFEYKDNILVKQGEDIRFTFLDFKNFLKKHLFYKITDISLREHLLNEVSALFHQGALTNLLGKALIQDLQPESPIASIKCKKTLHFTATNTGCVMKELNQCTRFVQNSKSGSEQFIANTNEYFACAESTICITAKKSTAKQPKISYTCTDLTVKVYDSRIKKIFGIRTILEKIADFLRDITGMNKSKTVDSTPKLRR